MGREHGTDLETRALGNEALQGAGICARQGKVRDTRQRGKGEPRARERGRKKKAFGSLVAEAVKENRA